MIDVDEQQLLSIQKNFQELGKSINDRYIRRRAFLKAAQIVKKGVQSKIKDSKRPHYRQDVGRKITYYPGNLRKSIKRLQFRRSPDVFVGPLLRNRKAGASVGKSAGTAEGYYAAMSRGVNSDADKFDREVLTPGVASSSASAIEAAKKEVDRLMKKFNFK
jgi:hypothetical protein